MRTIKEHIFERLKITSKVDEYIKPTYQEYYDLLDAYCKANNEKFLSLDRVFDYDDDLLPRYKHKNRAIVTIRPSYSNAPEITLKTYDVETLQDSFSYGIHVSRVADKKVSFMPDEDVEKTVKYMEENIK
jgi:hypothetical protein